jgi:zinc/manganese transport system substrate-binding protein
MLRLAALLLAVLALPAAAALNVFATVPEWAALAKEIGGERVQVFSATNALQDPHRIEAKPSLIARARASQLVVATGADLEIGWLPVVLRESGNAGIQPGQPAYFEAASAVRLIEVPAVSTGPTGTCTRRQSPHSDRSAQHPQGCRGPGRVAEPHGSGRRGRLQGQPCPLQRALESRHGALGAGGRTIAGRAGVGAAPFLCLLGRLAGLKELGALEPKPGVEPGSAHLAGPAGAPEGDAGPDDPARGLLPPDGIRLARGAGRHPGGGAALHRGRQPRCG